MTPPLNGLILPGVTRQSIIQLCEQWKDIKVEQSNITMKQILKLEKEGRVCTSCHLKRRKNKLLLPKIRKYKHEYTGCIAYEMTP